MFSSGWRLFVVLSTFTCTLASKEIDFIVKAHHENSKVSSAVIAFGRRSYMEDYHIRFESETGVGIYAIFDGHVGDYTAKYSKKFFKGAIKEELQLKATDPEGCKYAEGPKHKLNYERMLNDLIHQAENDLKVSYQETKEKSGTTCILVVAEEKLLTVANLGDSRAVMCDEHGEAINLSFDHKPDAKCEKQRIEDAKGKIEYIEGWRVRGLAVSRSLGDFPRKEGHWKEIIAEPDIRTFDLDKHRPEFMILASDGLWDVMKSQEAIDFVKERYLTQDDFGAMELMIKAVQLLSRDNISIIIVVFQNGYYRVGSARA